MRLDGVQPPPALNTTVGRCLNHRLLSTQWLNGRSVSQPPPAGEGEDKYLIATSEQTLCAMHRKNWFEKGQVRWVGV